MATFKHPSSLNALQQFRQACTILLKTTRASNPAWYQDALDLNFQLHIRLDGASIATFYYDKRQDQWNEGPLLTEQILDDSGRMESFTSEILRLTRATGASSLGVVLHIADEFATTELKPELDNPAAIIELRDLAINDPAAILEDSSILATQASWRVIPYSAAGGESIGTTITITRQHAALLNALRDAGLKANFPVITQALSAPLVAIMNLCQTVDFTTGRPFIAILQYSWFTVLAFFNEHADLRLIRTLQHRGMRRATNLRNALTTTSASLEFVDPDIFVIPLGETVDTALHENLRLAYPTSNVEMVQTPTVPLLPTWCPEPFISAAPAAALNPKIKSHSFTVLRDDKWALQDFLPTPREDVEIFPNKSEMRLLRLTRLARIALFVVTGLVLALFSLGAVELLRKQEWWFDTTQTTAVKTRLTALNTELQKADHWNNLLEDRSKAWVAMEGLSRMFGENSGVLIKTYSHSVKPDNTDSKKASKDKAGILKEWKLTGFASEEALDLLNTLNTREGIAAHFIEIAEVTGNTAFDPRIGNRSISVNIPIRENSSYKPVVVDETNINDTSAYPFSFDLTITQRFESTDPLAINLKKAP